MQCVSRFPDVQHTLMHVEENLLSLQNKIVAISVEQTTYLEEIVKYVHITSNMSPADHTTRLYGTNPSGQQPVLSDAKQISR